MLTIIATAVAAIAAVKAYNTSKERDAEATQGKVVLIRQSVSVVSAITDAIWAVLDALIFLTRARSSNPGANNTQGSALRSPSFGRTVAADVTPAEA